MDDAIDAIGDDFDVDARRARARRDVDVESTTRRTIQEGGRSHARVNVVVDVREADGRTIGPMDDRTDRRSDRWVIGPMDDRTDGLARSMATSIRSPAID